MRRVSIRRLALAVAAVVTPPFTTGAQATPRGVSPVVLDSTTPLQLINGRASWVEYRGRRALKLLPRAGQENASDQEISAVLIGSWIDDGVIEVDVSGARRAGYATDDASAFKGFVGVSFRVRGDSAERFYVRTENARLPSQLFRNRSTQYESSPGFPWQRLRQESPGTYESYADMEAGAWTRLRIEVKGTTARLYVNGASQPALVVNDLKNGRGGGAIALWSRISSDAYFSNLRVSDASGAPESAPPRRPPMPPGAELPRIGNVLNGRSEIVTHRGVRAVHLIPAPETAGTDRDMLAILDRPAFSDGTIQIDVAGAPLPGASQGARGFVGISFRTGEQGEWSEVLYLRPTNGRAQEQIRRNHSVQYVSHPEFTWDRLRQESPGVYEAYVDLVPGEWTTMTIVVAGATAKLFINGASEPCLVVNDLKRGAGAGRIALWAHVETDAYFGPLMVTPR